MPCSARLVAAIEPDTSYVAVVDREGNAFSATPSDGSWNIPVIPGLGFVVSGRGSQSRPDPSHPCGVRPGGRPRLTPNPALCVTKDGAVIPFGSPGGDVQVQATSVLTEISRRDVGHWETLRLPWWNTREFVRLSQVEVPRGQESCDVDAWVEALTAREH